MDGQICASHDGLGRPANHVRLNPPTGPPDSLRPQGRQGRPIGPELSCLRSELVARPLGALKRGNPSRFAVKRANGSGVDLTAAFLDPAPRFYYCRRAWRACWTGWAACRVWLGKGEAAEPGAAAAVFHQGRMCLVYCVGCRYFPTGLLTPNAMPSSLCRHRPAAACDALGFSVLSALLLRQKASRRRPYGRHGLDSPA